MDRRSTSKSPTSEPAQSPPSREDEGGVGNNIWHPLSSIKMENNQNESSGNQGELEQDLEEEDKGVGEVDVDPEAADVDESGSGGGSDK